MGVYQTKPASVYESCLKAASSETDEEESIDFFAENVYPILNVKENLIHMQILFKK